MHDRALSQRCGRMAGLAILALMAGFSLSGCVGAVLIAGGASSLVVAQDRAFGEAIDDSVVDMRIQAELAKSDRNGTRNVNVDVSEGRVLLTGTVPRPEDRVTAARIAWSTPHVKEVVNELEVRDGSRFARLPKDKWISGRLRSELLAASKVKSINYGIETIDGTVYLFGTARTKAELDLVTAKARSIGGVKKVVSHVRLEDDPGQRQTLLSLDAAPPPMVEPGTGLRRDPVVIGRLE